MMKKVKCCRDSIEITNVSSKPRMINGQPDTVPDRQTDRQTDKQTDGLLLIANFMIGLYYLNKIMLVEVHTKAICSFFAHYFQISTGESCQSSKFPKS